MESKNSTAPFVLGAIVVALIAVVSGWAMRSRATVGTERIAVDTSAPVQVVEGARRAPSNRTPLASSSPIPGAELMALQAANDAAVSKLVNAGEQKLRGRYESERVDAAWASRKQQALERLSVSPQIEQLNAQPLSIDAHCRASVCLINADFPSRLAATDWHTLYTLNAGTEMSNSSMRSTVNPDGSVHVQIYGLARQ